MNSYAAVYGMLTGATALTVLVEDRIYPTVMPDRPTFPSVTYQKLAGHVEHGAESDPGLKRATFQVTSWASSLFEAVTVAKQVLAAVNRVRKTTVAGVAVDDCLVAGDGIDSFDPSTKVHFIHITFDIHYRE